MQGVVNEQGLSLQSDVTRRHTGTHHVRAHNRQDVRHGNVFPSLNISERSR